MNNGRTYSFKKPLLRIDIDDESRCAFVEGVKMLKTACLRQLRVHSTRMHSGSGHKEFFFEEHAAGYFEDQLPSSPGQYRYMPFRGPGHLRLVEALASSGSQRCYYVIEGEKHYFIVLKNPSHGVLLVHAHGSHQE